MADSTMRIIIQAVDKASGVLKGVAKNANDLGEAGGKTFAGISTGLLKVGAVAVATGIALKKAFEIGEQGAQINRLEVATTQLAKSYGANMGSIVLAVQNASLNTISRMDAIQSSGRAMMLGLGADATQLANLMEIAAFRGRVMGVNTTQAFNDIVTGIGRKSRLILDNLGIIIDADKAYQDYADSVGKSVDDLDAQAQTQAYLNAVLTEGNALMQQAGGLAFDSATAYERLRAKIKDLTDAAKENISWPVLEIIASKEEVQQVAAANEEVSRLMGNFDKWIGMVDRSTNWQPWQWDPVKEDWLQYSARMQPKFQEIMRYQGYEGISGKAPQAAEGGIDTVNRSFDLLVGLASGVTDIMEGYDDAVLKAGNGTVKLNAANEKLSDDITALTYDLATMNGQMDDNASFELAVKFGMIDEKTIALQQGISKINQAFDSNKNGVIELAEQTDNYWAAVDNLISNRDALMQDKSATWAITLLLNGMALSPTQAAAAGLIPTSSKGGASSYMMGTGGTVNLGGRAIGGPVSMGQPYVVGERGPEMFVPNSSGNIIPNDKMGASFKFYDRVSFILPDNGISASDLMRQMGVA